MGEHGKHRQLVRLAVLLSGLIAAPADAACRLALILALDASSSVDAREYALQRAGLAAALNAPDIRHAILHGGTGEVVLSVYEWSGRFQQKLQLDWTSLRSPEDITRAVAAIAGCGARPRISHGPRIGPGLWRAVDDAARRTARAG